MTDEQPEFEAVRREQRATFWTFVGLSVVQIGYLIYRPPTFSGWRDWLLVGGAIVCAVMAIISFRSMRNN